MMRPLIILVICISQVNCFLMQDVYDYETNTSIAVPLEADLRGNYGLYQDLEYLDSAIPIKFGSYNVPTVTEDSEPVQFECLRMSPKQMFTTISQVIESATKGIQFILDQSEQSDIWGDLLQSYLEDDQYEGVILLVRNQAVEQYEQYIEPFNNNSRGQIAAYSFVPASLNVDVIGPIEYTAQGSTVQLYRDYYVETEEQQQAYIDSIVPFPSSCQYVEFWILDGVLVPPVRNLPATFTAAPKLSVQPVQRTIPVQSLIENGFQRSQNLPSNSQVMEVDIMLDLESLEELFSPLTEYP
eukprot:TRINITY_DN12146_c0_g1_i3.p2 TRINITY_DN12146_c0_g1~~TRINITY_DN12146_c0_g1_i3.p2  ORF type:complete len:298 (-),score=19.28 TRINITY_DN12146_c0_g1_i3:190-1083(-)